MKRYPVPCDRWQLRQFTERFLFLLSTYFSPIGCELCFSQSWQAPQPSTVEALRMRRALSDAWGAWQAVQFPSWIGAWVRVPFSTLIFEAVFSCFAFSASRTW